MQQIADWLDKLGLSEHAQRFADNAIDLSVIRDLTEEDLKELGVLLGHRRKILRAIAELDAVPQPVAESYPRGKVHRRNRGCHIASSSRCRLTPSVTNIRQ